MNTYIRSSSSCLLKFSVLASLCRDRESTEMVFSMLENLLRLKVWTPDVRVMCTIMANYGLRDNKFPVLNDDVMLLRATGGKPHVVAGGTVRFIHMKLKNMLSLIDLYVRTYDIKIQEVQLLLQLVVTMASEQQWHPDLFEAARHCVFALLMEVESDKRVDVLRRVSDFFVRI